MSAQGQPAANVPEAGPGATTGNAREYGKLLWRTVVFLVKFLVGMVFCQAIFTSLIVIGWTYRMARFTAIKYWCRCAGSSSSTLFTKNEESLTGQGHWPNWFVAQNFCSLLRRTANAGRVRHLWTVCWGFSSSLRHNLVLGIQGAANTLVLTLPAGMMWWFGWDYGWNISFYKGYEQSFIGPAVFLIGSLFFIIIMFYLPMAQARQAACANWRSFWDVGLVIRIIGSQWIRVLLFSILLTLLCLPVLILKTAPSAFNLSEVKDITTPEQAEAYLGRYFFLASLYVFPCYVLIRVCAAKIYARGLLASVQNNRVGIKELDPFEQFVFKRLNLHPGSSPLPGNRFRKIVGWAGSRTGHLCSAVIIFLVWAILVAAILISEFFNYHEAGRGWWNQQLIQLPWFNYMPTHIRPVSQEITITLVLLVLVITCRYAVNCLRAMSRNRLPTD